jgi:hypothetical protein
MKPDGREDDAAEFDDRSIDDDQSTQVDSGGEGGIDAADHDDNVDYLVPVNVLLYGHFEHLKKTDSEGRLKGTWRRS